MLFRRLPIPLGGLSSRRCAAKGKRTVGALTARAGVSQPVRLQTSRRPEAGWIACATGHEGRHTYYSAQLGALARWSTGRVRWPVLADRFDDLEDLLKGWTNERNVSETRSVVSRREIAHPPGEDLARAHPTGVHLMRSADEERLQSCRWGTVSTCARVGWRVGLRGPVVGAEQKTELRLEFAP